jgi:hypothetical protein
MQFCVTRVILRDLAALVPQIFHSLHKITHFLTGYINSYCTTRTLAHNKSIFCSTLSELENFLLCERILINVTNCQNKSQANLKKKLHKNSSNKLLFL